MCVESFIHPVPDLYCHTRFFQSVIWTNVLEETIGPDKFSSALPTGPMVFYNSVQDAFVQNITAYRAVAGS